MDGQGHDDRRAGIERVRLSQHTRRARPRRRRPRPAGKQCRAADRGAGPTLPAGPLARGLPATAAIPSHRGVAGASEPATKTSARQTSSTTEARAAVTILISIDGFRADYLDRGASPTLARLAQTGVSAAMLPSFPSKTFPNHWTMVTGMVPDHNGIVANAMDDPAHPAEHFTMATDTPYWWDEAEPIWVTAENAGIRTATMFWPGANVAWGGTPTGYYGAVTGGVRPGDWTQYNQAITGDQRVAAVLDWMRRPAATRPKFVTLYFDTVDTAGHAFGPDAAQTTQAITAVDASIARLVDGLRALGQPANLVVVADHGMAATSSDRVVALDTLADAADYRIAETGPYATLYAMPGHEAALEKRLLGRHDHVDCWRKGQIPARFDYGKNPRIPPYLCLADSGWLVLDKTPVAPFSGGNHGYDNRAPAMRALFIANGPAFVGGRTLASFPNTDIAPLLRDLIGLPQNSKLDGTDAPFRAVIRPASAREMR